MRSLTLLIAGVLASAAVAGDLPALPPPPPPDNSAAPATNDLPLPPAPKDDVALPALPPPPAATANTPAAAKKSEKNTAKTVENVLPPLPAAPAAASSPAANDLPALPAAPTAALAPVTPIAENVSLDSGSSPAGGTAGVISGGRVNVRAGDSTKYEIIYTADPETPVTVFEKKGEWVKIAFPEKEFCYVEQRAVEGEVPMDIPEQGVARAVRNDQAKIYVRPWPGSTVVGTLKAGENIIVTGARGQYLRIRPPASAFAWVFEKFIRYNNAEVQTVELTAEERAAREKEDALQKTIDTAKAEQKGKLSGSKEMNPLLIKLRERTAAERQQREAQRAAVKNLINNIDKQMEAIDAETAARIDHINHTRVDQTKINEETMRAIEEGYRPGPPPGSLGNSASGWIEHVAFWRNRPTEYRLVKGQEIICYIRSNRYNLNDYNGRYVVVSGKIEKNPANNLNILVIDTLRLFDQQNIEEPAAFTPAHTPAAPLHDDRTAVRVIREEKTPIYRETTVYRDVANRDEQTVIIRDPAPISLEQNENIVIIEDEAGRDTRSSLHVGERIDVTGISVPAGR